MPHIRDRFNFQPSKDSIEKWLGTRKVGFSAGYTPIPGFFQDYKVGADNNWFYLAIVGEFLGALIILFGGATRGGRFLIAAIFVVILFIVLDFFFAHKLHRNVARNIYIDNKLFLIGDTRPAEAANLLQRKEEGKFKDYMFISGVVIIGLLKIASIFALGIFNSLMLIIPISIIYLIVSYIHINHTGYALAHKNTEKAIEKDYKKYASGQGLNTAQKYQHIFKSSSPLVLPISIGNNIIIEKDVTGDSESYILKTTGILTDDDIQTLINGQDNDQRRIIAYESRKHQLQNLCSVLM